MRELKFRAWHLRIETQEWAMGETFEPLSNEYLSRVSHRSTSWADDVVFMQYTGLKDKNGKEIYEGDIVKYSWDKMCESCGNFEPFKVGEIHWNQYCFWQLGKEEGMLYYNRSRSIKAGATGDLPYVEIIGNIYENPELLNA